MNTSTEGAKANCYASREAASSVPTASFTGEDSVLQDASRWLAECSDNHLNCQSENLDTSWMPLRLVKTKCMVGSDYSFRCVDTSIDRLPPQRYLTLSYRWGRPKGLQLATSTLHVLSSWTNAEVLPRTLREALVVCAYLKISYIWIDRLCVIQDDPQD